jgi:hypothetical protein
MSSTTALITGASSGIGRELADLFAADGHALILVARRKQRLEALAEELTRKHAVDVAVRSYDLAEPDSPKSIFEQLQKEGREVDYLVNNAGFGLGGAFQTLPMEDQLKMIAVNVTSPTHLTRLFLPGMLQRGTGGVLNVASTAAFQPGPYLAVYYATKAYVLSLSEALATELAGSGLKISCLAPGPTKTEFAERANVEDSLLFRASVMEARKVAEIGYRGFHKGKTLIIPGFLNRCGPVLVRCLPRSLVRLFTARINRP